MKVLAIGAHPDDLEFECFGTLVKCVERGDEVYVCGVTNGNLGHHTIPPKELGEMRKKEAENSALFIGAKKYFNLDVGDMYVNRYDRQVLNDMIDVIREVKPDFIITHSLDDYHVDHTETAALVFNAAFTATLPNYKTKVDDYVKHNIPIFHMEPSIKLDIPNATFIVDVTNQMETKLKALQCHKTQFVWLGGGEDQTQKILDDTKAQARAMGKYGGAFYGEAFFINRHTQRYVKGRNLLP